MKIDLRRNSLTVFFLISTALASAQNSVHILKTAFTEASFADVWFTKMVGKLPRRVAEFRAMPGEKNFAFSIPQDSLADYRLQILFLKAGKHHPEIVNTAVLPLSLGLGKDYVLNITPSKLDVNKRRGWEVKSVTPLKTDLITGKVLNVKGSQGIEMQAVKDGALVSMGTVFTNDKGDFIIPCNIKREGLYYLTSPRWQVRLYLRPSSNEQIVIDSKTGLFSCENHQGVNETFSKWQQLISPITAYGYNSVFKDSVNLESYIEQYKQLQPAMNQFAAAINIADPKQYLIVQNAIQLDQELAPLNLLFQLSAKKINGFRTTPKEFNEVPPFYMGFIQPAKFSSADILKFGEARQFMQLYARLNLGLLPKEEREKMTEPDRLKVMMEAIANDTLKSFFLKDQLDHAQINNLSEFNETFGPFKKYANLTSARNSYTDVYNLFSGDTAFIGKSSYNFSLPDTAGKLVSMSSFKGKVVFIDVWATWCGPCRAQFPFLKQVEEEYADNKDLVFIGISLDKVEARQKWHDMIEKEKLGGVQLLDDFGKSFGRKYQVAAIPRFMLIDKQGRWIEIRCPLPENKEELKRYIDKALMSLPADEARDREARN